MAERWPDVVVVTGAGSGIGRATAEAFAADGATVVCADIDAAAAQRTADNLRGTGTGTAYRLDVADPDAWDAFAETVRTEHGVPDVVVNNAGIGMGGPFLAHTAQDWRRIVDVNLLGVVHGCRVFGAQLAQRHAEQPGARGHLVNVASAAAFTPSRALPAYGATKAAVLMLGESLRAEFAGHRVGVSTICPGFIATGIYQATTYVGVAADGGRRRGALADAFFGRWAPGPELVARRIRGAVRRNRPVVPVTPGAWVSYGVYHLAPPVARLTARLGGDTAIARLERLGERLLGERLLGTPDRRGRDISHGT